jgi:hypothetical protein
LAFEHDDLKKATADQPHRTPARVDAPDLDAEAESGYIFSGAIENLCCLTYTVPEQVIMAWFYQTISTVFNGSSFRGQEWLCGEIASAFVCASLGIEPTVRHANYLGAWLDILRENNRAIIRAASAA